MNGKGLQGNSVCIVIVTYQRTDLLKILLDSIDRLIKSPDGVIVVDNDGSDSVQSIVTEFANKHVNSLLVKYIGQHNSGGAGGFHTGVKEAYESGFDWIWVMDDDVRLLPHSLESLSKYMTDYHILLGNKIFMDGTVSRWQFKFNTKLGLPAQFKFEHFINGVQIMNNVTFEGTMFHSSVIQKIGFPDSRFFLNWDDTTYGLLATKFFKAALVKETTIQKTRKQSDFGYKGRFMYKSSNLKRFYIIRNRGMLARYMKIIGLYCPFYFACGTFIQILKEVGRMTIIERHISKKGIVSLFNGYKSYRAILHDSQWSPQSFSLSDV